MLAFVARLGLLLTLLGQGVAQISRRPPSQIRLVHDLLDNYDPKAKPIWDNALPINVTFSMDLYQILDLNEPQQYILLNAWIIERWSDEFLFWVPEEYDNITEIRLPYHSIWLPDTTLYNSLVMKDDDSRRLLNAKLTTNLETRAAYIELLYPTIYKFSCLLNLRYFPFDVQICSMTFSSWTYDQKGIDYFPHDKVIGTSNYLENEGWLILKTKVARNEVKYSCCPNNYTLLQLTLYLRRKPLFYLVNLIIPTSIITLIAIVGFFTTSSASGAREEKVSLGITTLLSMSILMMIVSDQMPTTSTFIPLIGWFILAMIIVISLGTIVSSVIIAVQKRGRLGERLSPKALRIGKFLAYISCTGLPKHLKLDGDTASCGPEAPDEKPAPPPKPARKWTLKSKKGDAGGASVMLGGPRNNGNIVSEKSTEPLMLAPLTPATSDGPPSPTASTQADGDSRDPTKSMLAKVAFSMRPVENKDKSKSDVFASSASVIRQNRQLAQVEYEWLATVLERCFFALFVFLFLVITIGINLVGFAHWFKETDEIERGLTV